MKTVRVFEILSFTSLLLISSLLLRWHGTLSQAAAPTSLTSSHANQDLTVINFRPGSWPHQNELAIPECCFRYGKYGRGYCARKVLPSGLFERMQASIGDIVYVDDWRPESKVV